MIKSMIACFILVLALMSIADSQHYDCGESPIRKPPRFGKRFENSNGIMMVRGKNNSPCGLPKIGGYMRDTRQRVSQNNEIDDTLFIEWILNRMQNNDKYYSRV